MTVEGVIRKVSLRQYTTYRIGGEAEYFAEANSVPDLKRLLNFDSDAFILGGGSNVLVSDSGVKGLVIAVRFREVKTDGAYIVADGGAPLAKAAKTAFDCGLSGLEWACGIPGSVGGAVRMNAGAFGGCVADVLEYADVLRGGEVIRLSPEELDFSYRHSAITRGTTVVKAAFKLTPSDKTGIASAQRAFADKRKSSQPSGYSAGSVFKAADKPAGWYIDRAGLKGLALGGAVVSPKHANFIINTGNARASDVASLIDAIKAEVFVRFNVMLEEEIEYVN